MLSYVYNTKGKSELHNSPQPKTGSDSAVIAVRMAAICGTDLRARKFGSESIVPPRIIGHEVVGEIIEIGGDVKEFSIGDRVQIAPAIGCGTCPSCVSGHTNICDSLRTIGFHYDGSFAQYMAIPALAFRNGNVTKLDDAVPDDLAIIAEPTACVLNSHEFLRLEDAKTVAIFGSGFIGSMHAEIALSRGVKTVIIIEIDPARRQMAADTIKEAVILDPADGSFPKLILDLTNGYGVDVSIVACSVGKAQSDALNITAKLGRVSLFGGLSGQSTGYLDSNIIHYREISVHGVHASTPGQNRTALKLLTSGKIRTENIRRDLFPLSGIEKAFTMLEAGSIMKALIKP